jgi:hypothetical protein
MPTLPKGYSQAAVEKLLRDRKCSVPFHVVRTRFLGNIATPGPSIPPIEMVKGLWNGALPAVDSMETLNRILEMLVMGLWNDVARHQKRSEPFRLLRPDIAEDRAGLARLARIRKDELDGFADGLFGADDRLALPGRASEAVDRLGEMRAMFAGIIDVAARDVGASDKQIAETFRRVRELTKIAEKEIHEAVIACTRARQSAHSKASGGKRRMH